MKNFPSLDRHKKLEAIQEQERKIRALEANISEAKFQLQEMKRINAIGLTIQWHDSIDWCVDVDYESPNYFIKSSSFISECVAKKYGIEVTRDIKNKIATTLSIMFNKGLLGRIQKGTQTYYGKPDLFKKDKDDKLTILKPKYMNWYNNLF